MPTLTISSDRAIAFRLDRQHLAGAGAASAVQVCADLGGVQAQLMSAAELAIRVRSPTATRREIAAGLWQTHRLVRTSCMRATLHLISARDFSGWIAALGESVMGRRRSVLARLGVTAAEMATMNARIVEALADGPMTHRELVAILRSGASRPLRVWLDRSSSAVRPAVIEGLICYGPPRGAEATFVRVDRWLSRRPAVSAARGRASLARRFLAAYGPATAHDFAHWSGLSVREARAVWHALGAELADISVDAAPASILARDLAALRASRLDAEDVRLLGGFDPLLLAHASKDELVSARDYPRVYREQWWISPVVLVGGRIAGVWSMTQARGKASIHVAWFGKPTRADRAGVEREAEALGTFLGLATTLG